MIRLQRGPRPDLWTKERDRVKEWTRRWLTKCMTGRPWVWPQYQKKRLNQYLYEVMAAWHYDKCAFCEAPLYSGVEIEHFRSKARYSLAAFVWRNLFLACQSCNQTKGAEEHKGCLKPDRDDPTHYLWANPIVLKVEPKSGLSAEQRQRALTTIKRYGLDRPELTRLYQRWLERFPGQPSAIRPEEPFSLMVSSYLAYKSRLTSTAGSL